MLLRIKLAFFVVLPTALWWATPRFGMIGAISSVVIIGVADWAVQTWIFARVLRFGRRHLSLLRDAAKLALKRGRGRGTDGRRTAVDGRIAPAPGVGGLRCHIHSRLSSIVRCGEPDEKQFLLRTLISPIQ